MFKTLLATVSIAAIGISTAMAADLGAMPTKAPNFVAPSWTGAYVGLNAGYGWGNSDATALINDLGLPLNVPSLNPKGFIGGGQVGYNWQAGPWVLGGELDLSGMNVKADQTMNPFFVGKATAAATYSTQYDWLLTARARAGVTFAQNWLLYVTGGLAVTQVKDSIFAVSGSETMVWSGSKTLVGGTVGAGVEYAVAPNWSMKAEYLYAKFDDTAPPLTHASSGPVPSEYNTIAKFSHDLNIVRVGINYKFGG